MKAGRELDALVAEVMEWELNDRDPLSWIDSQGKFRTWENTSFKSFRPSEDIAATKELIIKLVVKQGYAFSLHIDYGTALLAEARFWEPAQGMHDKPFTAYGPIEWAICVAALKAKGIDA